MNPVVDLSHHSIVTIIGGLFDKDKSSKHAQGVTTG